MVHFNNVTGLAQVSPRCVTDGDKREVELCTGCCHGVLYRVVSWGFVQGVVMGFCTGCCHGVLYRVLSWGFVQGAVMGFCTGCCHEVLYRVLS
jgi:hypothetical protein